MFEEGTMAGIDEWTGVVRAFCEERDWDQFHGPKDLAIGLSTEAAELLELFRFKSEKEIEMKLQDPVYRGKIADELADVFFFLLRFSQKHGFSLDQALAGKMRKNAEKYPVSRAKGSNLKYNEE